MASIMQMLSLLCFGLTASLTQASAASNPSGGGDWGIAGLQHHTVMVDGLRIHYVVAGQGEPVLLIPGWPQSWIAWRKVIPKLVAAGRSVYVLDPRGTGDSEVTDRGYDLESAANDIHGFITAVGLQRPGGIDIVSHDVGTWIAFTHAGKYPTDVRRLVLSEAQVPGMANPPDATFSDPINLKTWHFAFNRLEGLPEMLVAGHEREYLAWLFENKGAPGWLMDEKALDEYTRAFSGPGRAKASFSYYRENFGAESKAQAEMRASRALNAPTLTIGGEFSVGPALAAALKPRYPNVEGVVLKDCGHFAPEERPSEFASAVIAFWAAHPR